MKNIGFKNIDGLDISQNMLNIAENKKAYTDLFKVKLGQDEFYKTFPPLLRNRFDFATCTGFINGNHMDEKIFE